MCRLEYRKSRFYVLGFLKLVGQVYWVCVSGLLGGPASLGLLGGVRFAGCNLLVGVCWGGEVG